RRHRARHPPVAGTSSSRAAPRAGKTPTIVRCGVRWLPLTLTDRNLWSHGRDLMTATQTPDLAAIKQRQQQAWSAGDFAMVGSAITMVSESLCEAADLRAGQRVLDVATGSGNTAIAAARRWCEVTGVDYVPALLERARE